MSRGIIMALVLNLLHLLFSAALVHSHQYIVPLRSFKISENVTYDCIDIYKQPGLDHPLLKNHTIQMKPSVLSPESKNQTSNSKTYKKKIRCPDGTVPILRNSKEYITNTQFFAEKYFHPLSDDSPATHIAGVRSSNGLYRGIEGCLNAYALNIENDQASGSRIFIGNASDNQLNSIEAGVMINPGLFGDGRVWSYVYWKGKDGKGCYNTACPGFVQVSHEVPIAEPIDLKPGVPVWWPVSIHQDKQTGNWWISLLSKPRVDIGYWPKELFNFLDNGANIVEVGGVVQASRSGSSPPMGNGKFPTKGLRGSAKVTNIGVLNSNYVRCGIYSFPLQKCVDSLKCYDIEVPPLHRPQLGFFFNFGGPGGKSCGV